MKSRAAGFTLVELIVVIAILGILAAFAVPKFISVERNARIASIKALSGSLQAASALAHAQAIVEGNGTTATATTVVEGSTVALAFGYPTRAAVGGNDGITAMINSEGYDYASSTGIFTITGYSGANCQVTYTQAANATTPATIQADTAGCN